MSEERIDRINETDEQRHRRHEMMRRKQRESKNKKLAIIAFIMSFALFLELATVGMYLGLFSTSTAKRLGSYFSNYSDEAYKTVTQRIEAVTIKNGFPTTIYDQIITQERVNITLQAFINDLTETDYSDNVPTEDIKKALNENVLLHLKNTGVKVEGDVAANVESYVTQCINTYKNTLIFSHFRTIRQMKVYIFYVVVVMTIVCVTIIVICLILLNRYLARKRQLLRYIIYAVGTSFILIFIPSFLLYNRLVPIYIKGMRLGYQFDLIMNYFYNSFHVMLIFSYMLFIVYAILLAGWYYMASQKRGHF